MRLSVYSFLIALVVIAAGCSRMTSLRGKSRAKITEEARVLTTGVVDSLNLSTNKEPAVQVAKVLGRQNQRLVGLPLEPLDVAPLIASNAAAISALNARFDKQNAMLADLAKATEALVAKGEVKESEDSKRWFWRIFGGLGFTGVIAGLFALFIFCPPALAIFGHLIGWIVSKLPGLASMLGVVAKSSFDSVVRGVEKAKEAMGDHSKPLMDSLSKELDQKDKALVRSRLAILKD